MEITLAPQLWRADDIENLSVCRFCGRRDEIRTVNDTGIPFRVCDQCIGEQGPASTAENVEQRT